MQGSTEGLVTPVLRVHITPRLMQMRNSFHIPLGISARSLGYHYWERDLSAAVEMDAVPRGNAGEED